VDQPPPRKPEVADDQPIARKPTTEVAPKPRPVPQVEQRVAQPGDRICGTCAEPNDPARKFCRRCGAGLGEAKIVAAVKLPWWKRIFGGGGKPKEYAAGERIGSMQKAAPKTGGLRGILKSIGLVRGLLALVVAIGIFGYIGIPSFQSVVTSALDPVLHGGPTQIVENIRKMVAPTPVVERPVAIAATSELADHAATRLIDTFSNTDWQGDDKAPEITVTFEEPVDLLSVIVHAGNGDAFVDFRRPATLEFEFPDGSTKRVDLEDVKDPQTFDLSANAVDRLVIRVVDTNGPEAAPISISELEFFKKT
jgi:hypothetical protein